MMNVLVFLMIVAGVRTMTGACPFMCTCHEYVRDQYQKNTLYFTSISCNHFNNNLTQYLDNTTKDLQLNNFIKQDLQQFFQDFNASELPYLDNIVIKNSELDNLNISVNGLEQIQTLSLSSNKLKVIPEVFLNLSSLQTMDVSCNEIKVIELQPFRTFTILEVLNLSTNSLYKIDPDSFVGLTTLKCLDLSKNNLTNIDNQLLLPLTSLKYLNLSNNLLKVLNEVSFSSLVRLQQLDVSWNRLARVAPGSLQLPSLARLLLAGNPQLGGSRDAAVLVGTGRRLQTVDASRTGLKQVPAALTHSIRTLRLAGNSIQYVNCGDVDSYPLLQLLDFTSNNLEKIQDDALGRLDSLAILYLTDNHINEIPKSLPEKLKVLHLEHNNINQVSRDDLQGLSELEVLLLSDNKIRIVEEAAFSQLVSLVTLDLSRNPVTILQPGCLTGPPALQVLRLSSIGIISPAEDVSFPLSTTEHLIILDLSKSPGLARQFLADTAALAASRELQELDLSSTGIEYIRADLLHYLSQLRAMHIKDNRLNCTGMQWLAEWMRRQDELEYRTITCSSPPDLWGTLVIDLQEREILQTTTTTSTIISNINMDNTIIPAVVGTHNYKRQEINNIPKVTVNNYQLKKNKTDVNKPIKIMNDVIENTDNFNLISRKFVNSKKDLVNGKQAKNENVIQNGGLTSESTSPYSITTESLNNEDASTTEEDSQTTTSFDRIVNENELTVDHTSSANTNSNTIHHLRVSSTTTESYANNDDDDVEKFRNNKLDNIHIFNKTEKLIVSTVTTSYLTTGMIDDNITINSSQWNITTGEMSMFTTNDRNVNFLHPGMLILAVGVLGACAALAMLAARFTKRRRNSRLFQEETIEVSSLPSVTELW